jgi:TniQ
MNINPLITPTTPMYRGHQHHVVAEKVIEMPPRSRLYCLPPLGMGTVEVESLTSYIQRLAWAYRVSSWVLVVQEVLPLYNGPYDLRSSAQRLGGFGRTRAMRLNGTGAVASAWVKTLEQLTGRSDLHVLTADPWASGLPNWGFLRSAPVCCPACYQHWQEQGQPVYQPLLWALQAVTACLHHRQP